MLFERHTRVDISTKGKLERLAKLLSSADAIVIGAGAGLSSAAGLHYGGARFEKLFPDIKARYGLTDMYSAAFYPFPSPEEHWAYFSRHIYHNRYESELNDCYDRLFSLVNGKNYFVLSTNADHLFIRSGFDKKRVFYTQGDYGLFQCSEPCYQETFDNKELVYQMVREQKEGKIPSELIPHCPICGKAMTMNLRKDSGFVEDRGWEEAMVRYQDFLEQNLSRKILFLELGVGYNTPGIIKYPFWQMCYEYKDAQFVSMNLDERRLPMEIGEKSLVLEGDIYEHLVVLSEMLPTSL